MMPVAAVAEAKRSAGASGNRGAARYLTIRDLRARSEPPSPPATHSSSEDSVVTPPVNADSIAKRDRDALMMILSSQRRRRRARLSY